MFRQEQIKDGQEDNYRHGTQYHSVQAKCADSPEDCKKDHQRMQLNPVFKYKRPEKCVRCGNKNSTNNHEQYSA